MFRSSLSPKRRLNTSSSALAVSANHTIDCHAFQRWSQVHSSNAHFAYTASYLSCFVVAHTVSLSEIVGEILFSAR